MSTGGRTGPWVSGLVTVMLGALKSAALETNRAPGRARSASSSLYSRCDSSSKPCSAAAASGTTAASSSINNQRLRIMVNFLSVGCRIDPYRESAGRDLRIGRLDHQRARGARIHFGERLLHLAGGIASLDAQVEEIDLAVAQESDHQRGSRRLRCPHHEIHLRGGEAEAAGIHLVAGVELVRIEH